MAELEIIEGLQKTICDLERISSVLPLIHEERAVIQICIELLTIRKSWYEVKLKNRLEGEQKVVPE